MAKYHYFFNNTRPTYALHECEDYLVLDAWLQIKRYGLSNDPKLSNFKDKYLASGKMLADSDYNLIFSRVENNNKEHLLPLEFIDGHSSTYSMTKDEAKATLRKSMLENLSSMTPDRRHAFLVQQRLKADMLEPQETPTTSPFAEPPQPTSKFTSEEIKRRNLALQAAQAQKDEEKEIAPQPVGDQALHDKIDSLQSEVSTLRNLVVDLTTRINSIFK